MHKGAGLLITVLFVLLTVGSQWEAQAGMYVCVDARGKTRYTNVVSNGNCRPLKTTVGISKRPGGGSISSSRTRSSLGRSASAVSYNQSIRRASRRHNVDPYLIMAVIKTESDFDQFALSKTGAQGLMQLMPETARELNVLNPFNPHENIDGGTRYLRRMLDLFDGNLRLSLAAYNAGPTLVGRLQKVPRIPETIRYVKKVLAHYKKYRGSVPQSTVRLAVSQDNR